MKSASEVLSAIHVRSSALPCALVATPRLPPLPSAPPHPLPVPGPSGGTRAAPPSLRPTPLWSALSRLPEKPSLLLPPPTHTQPDDSPLLPLVAAFLERLRCHPNDPHPRPASASRRRRARRAPWPLSTPPPSTRCSLHPIATDPRTLAHPPSRLLLTSVPRRACLLLASCGAPVSPSSRTCLHPISILLPLCCAQQSICAVVRRGVG